MSTENVASLVSAVVRAEHRHAARLAAALDLPLTDTVALHHLAHAPLTAGQLASVLGLSSGSTTALIDRLVAHDYAARAPHATDRRSIVVSLTGSGYRRTWEAVRAFVGALEHAEAELSPPERESVGRFLARLAELIDADTDRLTVD
jgi:MarR family transcriptional regulator, organic hydroperoxide resistance regulator